MLKGFMVVAVGALLGLGAQAEELKTWAHESEVALVQTSGNSETASSSLKAKTTYNIDNSNSLTNTARYLRSETGGTETAKNWELGLRYERALSEVWGAFIGHLAEADSYSGYVQRNSTDLGAKYNFIKADKQKWVGEAGYRYVDTYSVAGEHAYANMARLFTKYNQTASESLTFELWAEYLPNAKNADAYLANGEVSLTNILSNLFSLKLAYTGKYQNVPVVAGAKRLDTIFTTSLVAKF